MLELILQHVRVLVYAARTVLEPTLKLQGSWQGTGGADCRGEEDCGGVHIAEHWHIPAVENARAPASGSGNHHRCCFSARSFSDNTLFFETFCQAESASEYKQAELLRRRWSSAAACCVSSAQFESKNGQRAARIPRSMAGLSDRSVA